MPWERLEQAKRKWEEKLANYEYELSISSSAPQKFELRERIQECQKEIQRLHDAMCQKVLWVLELSANFDEFDQAKQEAITNFCQEISGDISLTLKKVKRGSIKLFFEGSQKGMEQIKALFDSGELTAILEIPIQNISQVIEEKEPSSQIQPRKNISQVIEEKKPTIRKKAENQKQDLVKEIQSTQPSNFLVPKMHILHLSDLHFGTLEQARTWSNQLAGDLRNELNISSLDALILSGDIANKSTPDEYEAAQRFLDDFRQDFPLQSEQIIIVPGNHDLNWQKSEEAYTPVRRKNYDGRTIVVNGEKQPDPNYAIDDGSRFVEKQDENDYKKRFAYFSDFYKSIKGKLYPLEYEQQCIIDYFPDKKLLILGLNSGWQLDHHYRSRASINMNALSNALNEIRRNSEYNSCRLKIAVWHHPLDSRGSDRITDPGFMEQLAVAGFRLFLHGHIHQANTSLYRYDMSIKGRKLDGICAGTFGAPTRELVPGYPWQYNLLKFEGNQLTVETRRREENNGAWKADARWGQGAGTDPLPRYSIELTNVKGSQFVSLEPNGVIPRPININDTLLNNYLVARRWRYADRETARVMYQATNYPTTRSLTVTDIEQFPQEVLRHIDRLWVQSSNNIFGFSVQSEIYINELNARRNHFDETIWRNFGERIRWRDEADWFFYENLPFALYDDRNQPLVGHLPRLVPWNQNDETFFKNLFHALLWRVHDLSA